MGMMKTGGGSGGGVGEIVEVQGGGHIVRATGRKDRHSKVYTAKGPRDRRVRLSAHTAIQFYDVQDRLGYDRPSKAVDWLIDKAKLAIDKLNESQQHGQDHHHADPPDLRALHAAGNENDNQQNEQQYSSSLASLEAMKTFFPTTSGTTTSSSNVNFQSYHPRHGGDDDDMVSRSDQDLGLSLHPSFQGGSAVAAAAVEDHHSNNIFATFVDANGFQRMSGSSWTTSELHHHHQQPSVATLLLGHQQQQQQQTLFLGQRGTLQSSFSQPFRSWEQQQQQQQQQQVSWVLGSHGMTMMQGLGVPTTRLHGGDQANEGVLVGLGPHPPSPSSPSPPNSHH